jgi:hypothetical protein
MPDKQWWLTWDLHIVHLDEPPKVFDSPDVSVFRLPFASAAEAALFKAELQRWLGSMLLTAIHQGRVQLAPNDSVTKPGEADNA